MFRIAQQLETLKTTVTGTMSKLNKRWLLASVGALALAAPAVAQASPHDRVGPVERREVEHREFEHRDYERHDHHDWDRHDWDHHDGRFGIGIRIGVPPIVVPETRVWVPPVYQTVVDQVWVPDQYEDREVRYLDNGRSCTRIDHVLVAPGHYESRDRQVCVVEGHYEVR